MPTPIEKLAEIAVQMETLAAPERRDMEADHGHGDDLLLEAFEWATRDYRVKKSADRILAAYRSAHQHWWFA